ncbi:MAG: response regulator [Sulfuricurvum sp.]|uniref:response regulator n=1 Tax=Sulfuricurvum sp. TaxID=2025608 RepID=UPI0026242766|nr:response regulator [Sulfuricurvum sp.]MDD2829341.1 response regulator [Sulfuricurvum sp.]MDD4949167.1 response regulator [Sulfuricurvum sp.]
MFNEFQQGIIIIVAIVVGIFVLYLIVKRSSTSQTHSDEPEKNDLAEVSVSAQETVEETPELHEEPIVELVSEIPLYGTEEGDFGVRTTTLEERVEESTDRRKSDKTIQKRSVPPHGKITKQNFAEFAGERILVAEDNVINQKVLVGLLAGSGIELVLANDGQEALNILENDTNFLMILMDAHMPRVDGFQATRIIRENPKYDHILVVALSGDTASDDIQKMKDAGMSEQLEKPLRMESLYQIIYAYTGKETQEEATITKILDADQGLDTCGGDEGFYREILSEFRTDYLNSSDKLGELLRSNNLQDADGYLLDIIGVTANIGADSLCAIASTMKLALSDTQERSYFILFDQYKIQLNSVMEEIKEYLG